eukprot:s7350_g1.t1
MAASILPMPGSGARVHNDLRRILGFGIRGSRHLSDHGSNVFVFAADMATWVYNFGDGKADGRAEMKNLLGGKGANLAESGQCHANPGLWLSSRMGLWGGLGLQSSSFDVCTHFYQNDCNYPKELNKQVEEALALVQKRTGRVFGDSANPLLVSVRSGARASMPGQVSANPQS